MIIIISLFVSWAILKIMGQDMGHLGFNKPKDRIKEVLIGFILFTLFACIQHLIVSLYTSSAISINPDYSPLEFLNQFRWVLNSVAYEEFLFRGVLFLICLRFIKPIQACWLNALLFGVYHWFSYGLFGNIIMMIFILILTGAMGFILSYAFVKSKGIILPIGLHLGWNFSTIMIYSKGPIGDGILIISDGSQYLNTSESLLFNLTLPILLISLGGVIVKRFYTKH